MGGKIPKSYYSKTVDSMNLEGFTKTVVARSSDLTLDFTIDRPGTLMELVVHRLHKATVDLGQSGGRRGKWGEEG